MFHPGMVSVEMYLMDIRILQDNNQSKLCLQVLLLNQRNLVHKDVGFQRWHNNQAL
jgi:hypothetical protein